MTKRILGILGVALLCHPMAGRAAEPIDLGGRRVLFVDRMFVDQMDGLVLRLHPPVRRETVMTFDKPWEGSGSDFERLIRVGDVFRMYYMGTRLTWADGTRKGPSVVCACVAMSRDGIHWTRPNLGLFAFHGSTRNNIVWRQPGLDNFTPFLDTNPDCPPDERFKATCSSGAGTLFGLKSSDGIHWSLISEEPIMTHGSFDSQNDAFWDPVRKRYWCYIRGFHDPAGASIRDTRHGTVGIRDIRVATSTDFRHWSEPKQIDFGDCPDEALYTSQIEPYYREPGLFVGFPTRYVERVFSAADMAALPDPVHRRRRMGFSPRYGTAITDGQFMTSRDGYHFHRWDETFIRPGPQRPNNWVYGDGYQSLGLIQTPSEDPGAEPELSCFVDEGHWKEGETLRRYTMRIDGFVSVHARRKPGEFETPLFVFSGRSLSLNFSTSAAGWIRVEVLSPDGRPIRGFALADCDELFGDTLDRHVAWAGPATLGSLAGRPVRLRFVLSDADLYSLRFEP